MTPVSGILITARRTVLRKNTPHECPCDHANFFTCKPKWGFETPKTHFI